MSSTHEVLSRILGLAIAFSVALGLAMLGYHSWQARRSRGRGAEIGELSLAFARNATGSTSAAELVAAAEAVSPEAFWETLESYSDAVSGEEWASVSSALKGIPYVRDEAHQLDHRSPWRRALAARHLGLLESEADLEHLRATMMQGPTLVTLTAALALARLKDRRALAWLLEHPEATERQGRHRMTALLKRFGSEFVDDIRTGLRNRSAEGTIYLAAIEVLGMWRDMKSRPLLEATLLVARLEARVSAARALGSLRQRASVPVLSDALTDPAWQVRAQAARSLGEIRLNAAVPPLVRSTSDASWWVRRNAAYALARQGACGMQALDRLSQLGSDRFAREMSVEVLQMSEWNRHSHGGLSRVE